MTEFSKWFFDLVKDIFKAIWNLLTDIVIGILEALLNALLALLSAIPAPSFMAGGFQTFINAIPGEVLYFASGFRLPECFAILGAAVLFRLTRKGLTLFQW